MKNPTDIPIVLVKTPDNGGCGECACECHTDVPEPGPHIASCKFADPNYVTPGFREHAEEGMRQVEHDFRKYLRDNKSGPS